LKHALILALLLVAAIAEGVEVNTTTTGGGGEKGKL
jgi:hypothetical protein